MRRTSTSSGRRPGARSTSTPTTRARTGWSPTRADLAPTATSSEIRYDALTDEWVAIAVAPAGPHPTCRPPTSARCARRARAARPRSRPPTTTSSSSRTGSRRFAESTADRPGSTGVPTSHAAAGRAGALRGGLLHQRPRHRRSPRCPRSGCALVIDAWADRTAELAALPRVEQVFCFENRGEEIGVTLGHPHGQIYAYPFVTPRTARAERRPRATASAPAATSSPTCWPPSGRRLPGRRSRASTGPRSSRPRPAGRWRCTSYPHRQVPDLPALDGGGARRLRPRLPRRAAAPGRPYDAPLPYIAAWHQAPVRTDRDLALLHLQVFSIRRAPDKLKYLAGSESGDGRLRQRRRARRRGGAAARGGRVSVTVTERDVVRDAFEPAPGRTSGRRPAGST